MKCLAPTKDGTIIEGNAYVNQAPITGESMPISKEIGDGVYSGTVIESGYLIVRADKVGEDTTFSRILQMVEEAQDKKAKTQKFLEVFSKYYTPGIMILAIAVYAITRDIELSLTLLVIACPGALVISTPVSIVAGIGNGARHGVLIKGGDIIEKLGTIKVLAFDKTGTLTEGKPRVTNIKSFGINEKELLSITASAEMYSEHPLARAILEKAGAKSGNSNIFKTPEDSQIIAGQGLKVKLEGKTILVGNRKLMNDNGTADAVLMSNEIRKLSYAIGLSRATVINMKQNIYFAIIVVGMLLIGVLSKTVFLSFGMLVHELSVLVVIINAIRLLGYKKGLINQA